MGLSCQRLGVGDVESVGAFVHGLEEILEVGEDVGVGFVSVLGYEFTVYADVEFAVAAGDEGEGADAVADAVKGVAGHPGGAEGVASIVAVFNFDSVFFGVGHGAAPFGGYFVCGKRRGFWVFASFRFSFGDDLFAKSNMAVIGGCSGVDPAVLGIRICFFFSWGNEW